MFDTSQIFLNAIKSGDSKIVTDMLNEDPFLLHSYDTQNMNALHFCCKNGNMDIIKQLPSIKSLNYIDSHDNTPLMHAVKNNHLEVVKFLLLTLYDNYSKENINEIEYK